MTNPVYTIGTLVTDPAQYEAMRRSFDAHGFTEPLCEYIAIDNTGAIQTSAYTGLNRVLTAARGSYVILCHQDVRLIADGRTELDDRLARLEAHDPYWAVVGNAGGVQPGRLAMRITDPHGRDRRVGNLPARVASIDENFMVVKRAARVGFSRDLDGFHFYGTDICLNADILGWRAYVIDFHLEHLSPGHRSEAFYAAQKAFCAKWSRALRPRWVQTTCALLRLSGSELGAKAGQAAARPLSGVLRRLNGASGWSSAR